MSAFCLTTYVKRKQEEENH